MNDSQESVVVPLLADGVARRLSAACFGLFKREARAGGQTPDCQWLLQWNRRWKAMSFVGGHKENDLDPSDLACVFREVYEELFDGISHSKLIELHKAICLQEEYDRSISTWQDPYLDAVVKSQNPPWAYPPFVEFSKSAGQWTEYHFRFYECRLTKTGADQLSNLAAGHPGRHAGDSAPNEWVSLSDIIQGRTKTGRPISGTVARVLGRPT